MIQSICVHAKNELFIDTLPGMQRNQIFDCRRAERVWGSCWTRFIREWIENYRRAICEYTKISIQSQLGTKARRCFSSPWYYAFDFRKITYVGEAGERANGLAGLPSIVPWQKWMMDMQPRPWQRPLQLLCHVDDRGTAGHVYRIRERVIAPAHNYTSLRRRFSWLN